ncbi:hypothetical protein C8F04DRAFT_964349, partial [Mycena alexandri]
STSKNPRVFGWLFPTLFPNGVGMVDNNNIRLSPDIGFRELDTRAHVQHLLSIAEYSLASPQIFHVRYE